MKCLPVIVCRPEYGEEGRHVLLAGHGGSTLLGHIAGKLEGMSAMGNPVLLMYRHDEPLASEAGSLGMLVISPGSGTLSLLRLAARAMMADCIVFMDARFPYIDGSLWRSQIEAALASRDGHTRTYPHAGLAPLAAVRGRKAIGAGIKALTSGGRGRFRRFLDSMHDGAGAETIAIDYPAIVYSLRAGWLDAETLTEHPVSEGMSLDTARAMASGEEAGRIIGRMHDHLCTRMRQSKKPHIANETLLRFEMLNAIGDVRSYPYDVAFTVNTYCNAKCVFCNYPNRDRIDPGGFGLSDFKRMDWLRYVSKIGFGGGLGEPLAHPEFLDIYRYILKEYPHMLVRVISNGTLLGSEHCREFAGSLYRLRISLNAASPESWHRIMRLGGENFEKILARVRELADLKKSRGVRNPEIILMMVVSSLNMHEMPDFVRLAHENGADAVSFNYFNKAIMPACDLPAEESVYFRKDRADEYLREAGSAADRLGVRKLMWPVPFSEGAEIFVGERVGRAPEICDAPWMTCYLANTRHTDRGAMMLPCCSGVESPVTYDPSDLGAERFHGLWNHDYLRDLRRKVNAPGHAPAMCAFCRSVDQSDPGSLSTCVKAFRGELPVVR